MSPFKKKILLASLSVCAVSFGYFSVPSYAVSSSYLGYSSSTTIEVHQPDWHTRGIAYDKAHDLFISEDYDGSDVTGTLAGSYLRNVAVDNVTAGITKAASDRSSAVSNESSARQAGDEKVASDITEYLKNAVVYDDASSANITLSGKDGTKVTNVADGSVSSGSMDAVSGNVLNNSKEAVSKESQDRVNSLNQAADIRKKADNDLNKRLGSLDGKSVSYINHSASAEKNISTLDETAKSLSDKIADNRADALNRISNEAKNRSDADSALDKAIGHFSDTTSSEFIKRNKSVSDNLSALDQAIDPAKERIASESEKASHAFDPETAERIAADKEISDKIGSFSDSDHVNYVDKNGSVSDNLVKLDKVNKQTADAIKQEFLDRAAAFNSLNSSFNSRYASLHKEMSRVGSGGAALAGVKFDEYSSHDKLDVGIGQGNYRGENTTAMGLRYSPNRHVSVAAKTTLGNNKNMWGMSLTVTPGAVSKHKEMTPELAELVRIKSISKKIDKQNDSMKDAFDELVKGGR